jgi:aerobic-type carbon monoxide dehydrogenase small subunit (CoxS/CutS family)
MDTTFTLIVNDQPHTVNTDPERPLLQVLREDLKLTGTKYGCGEGQCGACTVLIDGQRNHSCLLLVKEAAGKPILTIEGLSQGGELHPVQKAFEEEEAMQCGFCSSGMILSAVALLKENPKPTDEEVLLWMNAQICRCCGYPRILAALKRAANQLAR